MNFQPSESKKCDNDTKVHDKNDIHRNVKLL